MFGSSLAVLAVNLAIAAVAFAQDEKPAAAASTGSFSFFDVYILGGGGIGFLFLLPIEILSIATLAHLIEHSINFTRDKLVPPELVVELETLLEEEQYEEAINLCEASKNYLTNIVGAAIARVGEGYDAMKNAADNATEFENMKYIQKISWLVLYGNLGPLMGLFGTVVGMVMAFTQIAQSTGSPSPQELALGIFTALVTTIWGLLVSIPALGGFFYFKVKVTRLLFELSGVASDIVERFKPVAKGK
jgi:biopolymer transport protein ExbB